MKTHPFVSPYQRYGTFAINWRKAPVEDLSAFATGYRLAAESLLWKLRKQVSFPDHVAYPILYLYRHAVELYLKACAYRAWQLASAVSSVQKPDLWSEHSLSRLLDLLEAPLRVRGSGAPTWSLDKLNEIRDTLEALDDLDRGSFAFRYPITKAEKPSTGTVLVIDIFVFSERLDEALAHLVELTGAIERRQAKLQERQLPPVAT